MTKETVSKLQPLNRRWPELAASLSFAEFTHDNWVKTVLRVTEESTGSAKRPYVDNALQAWIPAKMPTMRVEKILRYCILNEWIVYIMNQTGAGE